MHSASSPSMDLAVYSKRALAFALDGVIGLVLSVFLSAMLILPAVIPDYHDRIQNISNILQERPGDVLSPSEKEDIESRIYQEIAPLTAPTMISLLVLLTLYFALSEILTKGSSLGKLLFRYRVYSTQTRQPVTRQTTLVRSLIKACCITLSPQNTLGFMFILTMLMLPVFTRNRQALHDLLAKTVVLNESGLWVRVDSVPPPTPPQ